MKKILLILTIILSSLSLIGCNSEITNADTPSDNELPQNQIDQNEGEGTTGSNNNTLLTPDYVDPNINYETTDSPSLVTPVEQTVEKVYDSVVSIEVSATSFSASGSGVLFAFDNEIGLSYIITCFHVIDGATSINVILSNQEIYEARLVAGYKDEDLALLSINKVGLTYAEIFDDSDELKLGSQVVCIGNPLGTLPGSVSSGYLSYKNRLIQVDDFNYMNLLQTDVAINSGNSGGGLFNTSGALIGIVNAKYTDESIEGLGFAIPSNTVKEVIADFISTAKYDKANNLWQEGYVIGDWELGFNISDGRVSTGGYPFGSVQYVVYVSSVSNNSTAAGYSQLATNDIITSARIDYLDNSKTDFSIQFSGAYTLLDSIYSASLELGDKIIFTVSRNNQTQEIVVEIPQYIYSI